VPEGMRRIFRLTDSGILALSIIAVVEFIGLGPSLPFPLNVSLYLFAICIPVAGLQAFMLTLEENPEMIRNSLGTNGHIALVAAAGFPFYLGTLYMISYFSLGASIVFGFASAVPYALSYLMSLWGRQRYFWAATTFLALLFVNAAFLAMGYWSIEINFFYDFLHWLPF
jgi:hypothetical protein